MTLEKEVSDLKRTNSELTEIRSRSPSPMKKEIRTISTKYLTTLEHEEDVFRKELVTYMGETLEDEVPDSSKTKDKLKGKSQEFFYRNQNDIEELTQQPLENIERLTISMGGSKEKLKNIEQLLKMLQNLTDLTIDASRIPTDDTLDDVVEWVNSTIMTLPNLEKLEIDFKKQKELNDTLIGMLCYGLHKKPKLNSLKFCFKGCENLKDGGIDYIKMALNYSSGIKELEIDLQGCTQISEKGFLVLIEGIKLLKSLVKLELNLRNCPSLNDTILKGIANVLLPVAKTLNKFSLEMGDSSNI